MSQNVPQLRLVAWCFLTVIVKLPLTGNLRNVPFSLHPLKEGEEILSHDW